MSDLVERIKNGERVKMEILSPEQLEERLSQAASLIDHQQARIVELEQQAAEIEALKAHGNQLSSNLLWLAETVETDFIPNLEDYMELKEHIDSIKALANQSPQASLAERDAALIREIMTYAHERYMASMIKSEKPDVEESIRLFEERVKRGEV